jgi:hypothetical protein
MHTRTGWLVALLLATAVQVGCNDDEDRPDDYVNTWASSNGDFKNYKTFAFWGPEDYPMSMDVPEIPEDVKKDLTIVNDATRTELTMLGLTEVKADENPDVFAFSLASTEDENAIYWECVPGNWWGYWGWYWDSCAWLQPIYVDYSVGTVIVGLNDPKKEQVVFGGLIQGIVYGDDSAQERIDDGVAKVFDEYPVTPPAEM